MPGETPQERGRREIVEDAISLVELAVRRSRSGRGDKNTRELVRGALEAALQDLRHMKAERPDRLPELQPGGAGSQDRIEESHSG